MYMDLLRLEVGQSFQFVPPALVLRRQQVMGPDGTPLYVYFRRGQRRVDPATDGDFCLTFDDTGLEFPPNAAPTGTPRPVPQKVLDGTTVVVKPWWLYADYRAPLPADRIGPDWKQRFPGFQPAPRCSRPEAAADACACAARRRRPSRPAPSTSAAGRATKKGDAAARGPADAAAERQRVREGATRARGVVPVGHRLRELGRSAAAASGSSAACRARGRSSIRRASSRRRTCRSAPRCPFEGQAAGCRGGRSCGGARRRARFLDAIFVDDRDVRELLTSRATEVNGPLAQFYRFIAGATCCGPGADVGYSAARAARRSGGDAERARPRGHRDAGCRSPIAGRTPPGS